MTADSPAAELAATKPVARAASGRDYLLLLFLSALWGWSFPLIKIGVATLPPLWVASGRIGPRRCHLADLHADPRHAAAARASHLAAARLMGIVGNHPALRPYQLGRVRVASGVAAILMAMVPMMVVVVAHFRLPDEPLTFGKSLGVILGIIGTLVLIGPSALAISATGSAAVSPARLRSWWRPSAMRARRSPAAACRRMPAESASGAHAAGRGTLGLIAAAIIDPPWTLAPSAGSLAGGSNPGRALHRAWLCTVLRHPDAGRRGVRVDEQLPGAALQRRLWPLRHGRAPAGQRLCRHGR